MSRAIIKPPRRSPGRQQRVTPQQRRTGAPTPINIVSIAATGNEVTVTFDQPVNLNGTPQYLANGAASPGDASATSATSILLEYSASPITTITVPFEDPAVRNGSGGFVNAGDLTVPVVPPAAQPAPALSDASAIESPKRKAA